MRHHGKILGRAVGLGVGILAVTAFQSRAAILYDNGPAVGTIDWCDQQTSQCNGNGWNIYDDFTLSANSQISGFTYNTYNFSGNLSTDYTGTLWSIWNANPQFNFVAGPIFHGNSVGSLSAGDAGSILVTVSGLNIDLAAGTYWLGTSNDVSNSSDITVYAVTNNGFFDASQSDNLGTFYNTKLEDAAFTIEGSSAVVAVPEPASLALFAPALLGLGFMLRRKRA